LKYLVLIFVFLLQAGRIGMLNPLARSLRVKGGWGGLAHWSSYKIKYSSFSISTQFITLFL